MQHSVSYAPQHTLLPRGENRPLSTSPHTNLHELLPPHAALPLKIKLLNHSHQLLFLQPLPELARHPPQILQADHALAFGVEQRKGAQDLVARIALGD
jgi:hypothetical protein